MIRDELFEKLKNGDAAVCNELMRTYGKRLYPRLYQRFGSRELADLAFKSTMLSFFDAVTHSDGSDPIEAMLFAEADKVELKLSEGELDRLIREVSETIETPAKTDAAPAGGDSLSGDETEQTAAPAAEPVTKKKHGIGAFGVVLLVLLALVMVWAVAGELMRMEVIPFANIGYEQFRALIMPYFEQI